MSLRKENSLSPALIIAKEPRIKCAIYIKQINIVLSISEHKMEAGKPDLSSLSIIPRNSFLCKDVPSSYDNTKEILLFPSGKTTVNENKVCRQEIELLDVLSNLKGIRDRLIDASAAIRSNNNDSVSKIDLFLKRSDAIAAEFFSAIHQYLHHHEQKLNTSSLLLLNDNMSISSSSSLSVQYLSDLYSQLEEAEKSGIIGENNHMEINKELSLITIQMNDVKNREHSLFLELSPLNFPSKSPIYTCDLPIDFEPEWRTTSMDYSQQSSTKKKSEKKITGIPYIFSQFQTILHTYGPFWDEMDDIDTNAWVLEPSLPAPRSCVERRIALRVGLSIFLIIDPQNPRNVPVSMRMIGMVQDIHQLRTSYQRYVASAEETFENKSDNKDENVWSNSLSVRSNLERCFGIQLPSPSTTEKSDFLVECGICYAHRLPLHDPSNESENDNTTIPNETCVNPSCARSYHQSCLFEWLQSLPSAKISFDRIFGTCPYCCEPISVKTLSKS